MDVLILGYGKIGKIKSAIWSSLGASVYVCDNDIKKTELIESAGLQVLREGQKFSKNLIIDICTPAGYHLSSLRQILNKLELRPKLVLIEKPVASSPEEVVGFQDLFNHKETRYLGKITFVNETYFFSKVLDLVISKIKENKSTIQRIRVELSKNRTEDIKKGRFIDSRLGVFGLELPHCAAILQKLGVNLESLQLNKNSTYSNSDQKNDEGIELKGTYRDISVEMASFLGGFRFDDKHKFVPNNEIIRTLRVTCEHRTYCIEFDPVENLERYNARLRVYNGEHLEEELEIPDNHLTHHIRAVYNDSVTPRAAKLTSISNALAISRLIVKWHDCAKLVNVRKYQGEYILISENSEDR